MINHKEKEIIKIKTAEGVWHSLEVEWLKDLASGDCGFIFKEGGCPECIDCSKDCPAFKEAFNRSYP
jgi:hypothetical protein